jgi:hypothetical protein
MRSLMAMAAVVMGIGVTGYLIAKERVVPPEVTSAHEVVKVDPLLATTYTKGARKRNLAAFGLSADQVDRVVERMKRIEDRHLRKVQLLLDGAPDPNAIVAALCGQTSQIRPRYGALRFLVKEKQGRRDPIRISRSTGLEIQEWSQVAPIADVYRVAELSEKREDDATLMAIAAILSGSETELIDGYSPWGRSILPGAWSWSKVVKTHPGVDERLEEYFALMHLFVEQATSDGGICGEEED